MEITQFVIKNWYLFAALALVLGLLLAEPITQLIHRVRKVGPTEAVMLINRENGIVVDVRDSKEFHSGHIGNAVNLPFAELKARVGELEKYKKRPLILSCAAGDRAAKGAVVLRKHGFENIAVLAGGMNAWIRSQLPVAK